MATRYVDPNAAAGGDGTTNGLSGGTAAYASLNIWEAARQGTLTEIENVICSTNGGLADTTQCTIAGWTTTAANYINITVDPAYRHTGVWGSTKFRVVVDANSEAPLRNGQPYTRMSGMQCENTHTPIGDAWFSFLHAPGVTAANDDSRFDSLICRNAQDGIYQADGRARWTNCLSYGNSGAGWRLSYTSGLTAELYNCDAVANTNNGFIRTSESAVLTVRNCYAGGNGEDYESTNFLNGANVTQAANASADSTGTIGYRLIAYSTSSGAFFLNVTAGSENLHIDPTSDLTDLGEDLSGIFTTDIDGETRPAVWSIGADQPTIEPPLPGIIQNMQIG